MVRLAANVDNANERIANCGGKPKTVSLSDVAGVQADLGLHAGGRPTIVSPLASKEKNKDKEKDKD